VNTLAETPPPPPPRACTCSCAHCQRPLNSTQLSSNIHT